MSSKPPTRSADLARIWHESSGVPSGSDYALLAELGCGFVGRSSGGLPAFVLPLPDLPDVAGRRTAGSELLAHRETRLSFGRTDTVSSAAALVCTDSELVDAFAVLVTDLATRIQSSGASWEIVLACVEEWQSLLAPRPRMSAEAELGLWGELWFIHQADDPNTVLGSWRGPERDSTDFFMGGKAVEVKTSKAVRQHHVSQSQVDSPVGLQESWLLSLWTKADPIQGSSVSSLVDDIRERVRDEADALRRLARAGYSPRDKKAYTTAYMVLAEPEWYSSDSIPRVRSADAGISQLRYRVSLDESRREPANSARALWRHFHGHEHTEMRR
jgi:hypothetical protein